ncbi:MAG: RNA-binding protein [Desulfobacterales bacterium]|nr:RNA-binding protein [Desulfobacterales bacterium]
MKIYIGNISKEVTEKNLRMVFEKFGKVESAQFVRDKQSGKLKGCGFVEMASETEGQAAIASLNGKALKGSTLDVNEALHSTGKRGSGSRKRPGGSRDGASVGRGIQGDSPGGYGGSRGRQGGDKGGQVRGRGGQGRGR